MSANATVAVLGAGSWGTALAVQLVRTGQTVRLWGHRPAHVARLQRERCNRPYLPDLTLPETLTITADLPAALAGAELVLIVVPSHAFAGTLRQSVPDLPAASDLAWATKGLEPDSHRLLHEVAHQYGGSDRSLAVVSGPNFAREVALGMPTALTVASTDSACAERVARRLHGSALRAYTSTDMVGVELGGAVKNVLAIATGIADGFGCGANARAAVITRGLAELVRLGEALGGQRETFMGLTGVGDLVLTCTDDQSRNRRFGLAIGRGRTTVQAQADIGLVEGAHAVHAVLQIARAHGIEMPICEQVDAILHRARRPRDAVEQLLARPLRSEA